MTSRGDDHGRHESTESEGEGWRGAALSSPGNRNKRGGRSDPIERRDRAPNENALRRCNVLGQEPRVRIRRIVRRTWRALRKRIQLVMTTAAIRYSRPNIR